MSFRVQVWQAVSVLLVAACSQPSGRSADDGGSASFIHACASESKAVCNGTLEVPLRWDDPNGAKIKVAFRKIPRSDLTQPSLGTVFGAVGGPASIIGYETIDFQPILQEGAFARRDFLVMDYRGFGLSTPLTCPQLNPQTPTAGNVAACAASLGESATAFYTANAVRDLRAVLDALQIDKIDLFGFSFGTRFGQAFALRYPERLRTLTLDSPARPDLSLVGTPSAIYSDLADLCTATAGCSVTQDAIRNLYGNVKARGLSLPTLGLLIDNASDVSLARELVAAMTAYLATDQAPLTRLVSELNKATSYANQNC